MGTVNYIPFFVVLGSALMCGCQGSPSSTAASPSPGSFQFGQQTTQAFNKFKDQLQGTTQAGNTVLQSGAQDAQQTVNTQVANIDAQRQQLVNQIQTSQGETKQALQNQMTALDTQRAQLASQLQQSGQSATQGLQQTRTAVNQAGQAIQQGFTTAVPPPPALAAPVR